MRQLQHFLLHLFPSKQPPRHYHSFLKSRDAIVPSLAYRQVTHCSIETGEWITENRCSAFGKFLKPQRLKLDDEAATTCLKNDCIIVLKKHRCRREQML
uniref:Uncharacterized protein n=1 Tax=Arundo donax TaxID=35708 RepID=A0A0A9DET5_ARUDO